MIHFPLWWFGPPAMLKGWMDRVFVYGQLYRSTLRYDTGICAGKRMIACVTTGAAADTCAHDGREGDTRMHLWPILYPCRYLGFEVLVPDVFHGVGGISFMEGRGDGMSPLDAYTVQWETTLRTLADRARVRYNRSDDFTSANRLKSNAPAYSPFTQHDPDLPVF